MAGKYTRIGLVQKPIGIKGEVKIEVEDDFLDDLVESDHLFLRINGSFVPWFIEELRETSYLILKLEEVDTPEKAARFTLHEIFLRTDDISSESFAQKQEQASLIGYTIVQNNEVIGVVDDVMEFPQQMMASVLVAEKQVLVPLNASFIEKIDDQQKLLFMSLPEGLLEL
jgi:16S rRNA processing protein RimM